MWDVGMYHEYLCHIPQFAILLQICSVGQRKLFCYQRNMISYSWYPCRSVLKLELYLLRYYLKPAIKGCHKQRLRFIGGFRGNNQSHSSLTLLYSLLVSSCLCKVSCFVQDSSILAILFFLNQRSVFACGLFLSEFQFSRVLLQQPF